MAFLLNYSDPKTGSALTYFVITSLSLDPINNGFTVNVGGYLNQAEFADGKEPVVNESFQIAGALFTAFMSSLSINDIPAGSPQTTVLAELLGALSQNMLSLPFFNGASYVA